jgi:hypothetical protein
MVVVLPIVALSFGRVGRIRANTQEYHKKKVALLNPFVNCQFLVVDEFWRDHFEIPKTLAQRLSNGLCFFLNAHRTLFQRGHLLIQWL